MVKKNKKAVSPVISTVLLVMIVLILAVIIFLWARGFIKEAILKEIAGTEKSTEQYCSEIKLESIINNGEFGFRNTGNVPIFKFDLKLERGGSSEIIEYPEDEGGGINPGFLIMIINKGNYNEYEKIEVLPTILGKGKSGGIKEFKCAESQSIQI